MENIYSVLITAITVLGGTTAWRYYEKKQAKKYEDDRWLRNDCTSRIAKLEALLEESSREKDSLRDTILQLTAQVSKLQVEVEYLRGFHAPMK
jgi:predicted negative regulator of RcsB-dependent stress response